MKRGLLLLTVAVLIVSLVLVGCDLQKTDNEEAESTVFTEEGLQIIKALSSGSGQQNGIWVNGTGKVTVVPDIAILRLGIEAQADSVAEASSQAASAMAAVKAVLIASGVAEKDIKTQRYSILPVTQWIEEEREQIITGYEVTNMVTATITDVDKAGSIIDAVAEAGDDLTRIDGISFTVDDPMPYYNEAREKAMEDAIAKAQQIAEIADVTLGKPTYISDSSNSISVPYTVQLRYDESGMDSTPISAGETDISVSVQIGFLIQ